jgi:hypothetical protein
MAKREEQEYSTQAPAGYVGDFLQQGIFPYAQQFLRDQFSNLGQADSSPFTYSGQRVADFDPREQYAMDLADSAIGSYRPYLGAQGNLLNSADQAIRGGTTGGVSQIGQGLSQGRTLGTLANMTGYGSTGAFNPNTISNYNNPFENQVVQQTLTDLDRQSAQQDMGLRDQAVSQGAFGGSRGRIAQSELARQQERGAAEAIAGIRSGGYQDAANRAQQGFESQQGRMAQQAGLQSQLGQNMFNMGLQGGQGYATLGNQAAQGFGNLGQQYQGMATLLPQLQQQDIQSMMGMGGLNRGRNQSLMDLNYQNFTGQYNLPMQTLQNVGSITSALGPLAGGYGYAGGDMPTNSAYFPNAGNIPGPYLPPIDNTAPPGTYPPPGTTPPGTTPPGTTPPGGGPGVGGGGGAGGGGGTVPIDPTAPIQQFAGGGGIGLPGLYNRYRR